jgi:hypothetical protein
MKQKNTETIISSGTRKREAFTIVEVLVVSAISIIIMGAAYNLLIGTKRQYTQGSFKFDIQMTAQNILEYIKTDLIQSCKLKESDDIIKIDGDTYVFYRFTPELVQPQNSTIGGSPIPERVTYTYDPATQVLTRQEDRIQASTLKKGARSVIGEKLKSFRIIKYQLNKRTYFRIELQILATKEQTKGSEEEITLITSIESRFENNYSEQAAWWDNYSTKITDISDELPIW